MKTPIVSILCITYNHDKYISQAIESFLMQKTDFDFEIIICDDASTDKNHEIISQYKKIHNSRINVIISEKNIGAQNNFIRGYNACKGKYIAICEGDDYWIDPLKLQKQVNLMEQNIDFSFSFHNAIIINQDTSISSIMKPTYFKQSYNFCDILQNYFIPTASVLLKKEILPILPAWFCNVYNGDWALQLLLSHENKVGYINENMSVYRKHGTSFSGTIAKDKILIINNKINLLETINCYYKFKQKVIIEPEINNYIKERNKVLLIKKFPIFYFYYFFKRRIIKLFKK